ncbi:MAG: hypothetical protein QOG63_481, partial [Thermoleophilaceae bacterium]|nr:hypothetical protein [Thermoleophilaceae bacterium]
MSRLLTAALAALLLLPAAASARALPHAHPIDLGKVKYGADPGLPDPNAQQHIPGWLRSWAAGGAHAAADYPGPIAKEEQYQDQHGHILTLATDNASVDLEPFANLLASTYHGDEIERIKVFVTNTAMLEQVCGGDAVACYGSTVGSRDGVMVVSYESDNIVHAVIHEYGHHIDNNTFNFAGRYGCRIDGDGSRRWFFTREARDDIIDVLTCDPNADWGHLLHEVYAEDYAQMVGIPRSEYHPAIAVPPPSGNQKAALKADIDNPFGPSQTTVKGSGGASRVVTVKLTFGIPVYLAARKRHGVRSVKVLGCRYSPLAHVYLGTCRIQVRTKRPNQRFSFKL